MSRRSYSTDKKGVELTLQTVVVAVLVLLVLVVVALIFQKVVGKSVSELLGISNSTSQEIGGGKCASLLLGRECVGTSLECTNAGYRPLPKPFNGWSDCQQGVCCERAAGRAEKPGVAEAPKAP